MVSPVTVCEKPIGLVPAPRFEPPVPAGARVPKVSLQAPGLVALQRNQPVAAELLGFAEPLSCADDEVTALAAMEVTDGPCGVANDSTVPNDVPTEFCAMAQK